MATVSTDELDDSLLRFAVHARELTGVPLRQRNQHQHWPPTLAQPPTPLEFARLLTAHTPVLIHGALPDRTRLWHEWQSTAYLRKRMQSATSQGDGQPPRLAVALTPNGRADDLVYLEDEHQPRRVVFALPCEVTMSFDELIKALQPQPPGQDPRRPAAYLQSQNSNLTQDAALAPLLDDLAFSPSSSTPASSYPDWASEAINAQPEATNIWIGTSHSRSSTHKDPYENLFLVVRGTKTFTVLPPTEAHFLSPEDTFYDVYQWTTRSPPTNGKGTEPNFVLEPVQGGIPTPWIPIDPLPPRKHPSSSTASLSEQPGAERPPPPHAAQRRWDRYRTQLDPLRITVKAGQMLYLPAGWFHAVEQEEDAPHCTSDDASNDAPDGGLCVAINWWWPNEVGERWAWLGLARELDRRCKGVFDPDEDMV